VSIFNVFYRTPLGTTLKCARVQLEENAKRQLEAVHFTYHNDFLTSNQQAIDPRLLPKSSGVFTLPCDKEAPGFIDDVLPDDWGKKVLARVHQLKHKLSVSELLTLTHHATTGSLFFLPENQHAEPVFGLGCSTSQINELHHIANKIDLGMASSEEVEQMKLSMFSRGSSVGGARPKVMVHDTEFAYIAKFPKQGDMFDYATVEHACLELLRKAGVCAAQSQLERESERKLEQELKQEQGNILFVKRFDVTPNLTGRFHQITLNSLLKNHQDQTDPFVAKYDHISQLISQFSVQPEQDNAQLFAQMLFNKILNNTDDHLRNFSFTCRENGWQLSPAYDVVPALTYGSYHQLTVGYHSTLPDLAHAADLHKSFNLTKTKAQDVIDEVKQAMQNWQTHFRQCGVSKADIEKLSNVINLA